jgi:hypothetical protein
MEAHSALSSAAAAVAAAGRGPAPQAAFTVVDSQAAWAEVARQYARWHAAVLLAQSQGAPDKECADSEAAMLLLGLGG